MSGWIVRCANSHPHAALGRTRTRIPLLTRRTGCCAQAESGVEQKWTACREACTADTVAADKYADASICLITVLQPNPLFSEPWRLFPRREGAKRGEMVVSQLA